MKTAQSKQYDSVVPSDNVLLIFMTVLQPNLSLNLTTVAMLTAAVTTIDSDR